MESNFQCSFCGGTPPDQVYQCRSGHLICSNCSTNHLFCTQCSPPTSFEEPKIRNVAVEQMLDSLTFACKFRESRCKMKSYRLEFAKHHHSCFYNPSLVKLDVPGCTDRSKIIANFLERGVKVEYGKLRINYWNFKSTKDISSNRMLKPVLICMDKRGPLILLLAKVDIIDKSASWVAVCVCEKEGQPLENFQMELTVQKMGAGAGCKPTTCTIPVANLEDVEESLWGAFPIKISLPFVRKCCENGDGISISVVLNQEFVETKMRFPSF